MPHQRKPNKHFHDENMADATRCSPRRLKTTSEKWHPLPLTVSTKKALMESYSHYENFSYDEEKGSFLVEVPVPPGRANIPRATPAVLRNHVEVEVKTARGRDYTITQPRDRLEECYSWWLGQLIHYDLQLELSTNEAKQCIKNAILENRLKVPRHLKKMEQSMRNAANRRAKIQKGRLIAKVSTSEEHRSTIKFESSASSSEDGGDIISTPSSRRNLPSRAKSAEDALSESDAVKDDDSSGSDQNSDMIDEIQPQNPPTTVIRSRRKNKNVMLNAQPMHVSRAMRPVYSTMTESSSDSGSDGEIQNIPRQLLDAEQDQDASEIDIDVEVVDLVNTVTLKTESAREDSDGEKSDVGSVSGDSEHDQAVSTNSQAINVASAFYGTVNTDSFSESSPDNGNKCEPTFQQVRRRNRGKKSTANNVPSIRTSDATPNSSFSQAAKVKELKIKRDWNSGPEELESAPTRDTTPSRTPEKCLDRDHTHSSATARQPIATIGSHLDMTYDDVHDPNMRQKIAELRGIFPRETIHLCYTCLFKHNGNYRDALTELNESTTAEMPESPIPEITQDGHTIVSSLKRTRLSLKKAATSQSCSSSTLQNHSTHSDSDETIMKQEPESVRRRHNGKLRLIPLISDDINGSQIDLTISDAADSSDEADSRPPPKKRNCKAERCKQSSRVKKHISKVKDAASVKVPGSPAAKAHTSEQ